LSKTEFSYGECTAWSSQFAASGIGLDGQTVPAIEAANAFLRIMRYPLTLYAEDTISILPTGNELGGILEVAVVNPRNGDPHEEPSLRTVLGYSMTGHGFRTRHKEYIYSTNPLQGYLAFTRKGLLIAGPTYGRLFPYIRAVDARIGTSGERMHHVPKPGGGSSEQRGDLVNISFNGYGFADWLDIFILGVSKGFLKPGKRLPPYFLATMEAFFGEVEAIGRNYLAECRTYPCRKCGQNNIQGDRVCASCGSPL
jgi:hypothetical protein